MTTLPICIYTVYKLCSNECKITTSILSHDMNPEIKQFRKLPPLLHQPVSFCVCFSCCSVLCPSFLGRGDTLAKSHRCWRDYIVETEGAAVILAEIHPERSFCGHVPLPLYPQPPTPTACWR